MDISTRTIDSFDVQQGYQGPKATTQRYSTSGQGLQNLGNCMKLGRHIANDTGRHTKVNADVAAVVDIVVDHMTGEVTKKQPFSVGV